MLIQRLRDGTEGIIAKVIVGIIIVVFGLFGFGSITTFLSPTPTVATVNGEEITQQEMEVAVERRRRLLLAQDTSPGDIDEDSLRTDVLQSLVSREVLRQAAEDMELHYGDAALDKDIIATEAFQVDGRFDAEQFRMVVGGAGYSPMLYRDDARADQLFQQMLSGISDSQFITRAESERLISLGEQTRDLAFLRIDVASVIDEVTVTDADIETYYKENPLTFVTEETLVLEYIDLRLEDLAAEVEVTEDDLLSEYESTKARYATDEQRRVSHILVEINDDIGEEEARGKIEELHKRILAGADFDGLARENSDDPGSAAKGGDLGFSAPGTFVPAFEAAAYSLGLNELSGPVLTEFGYHIIKVTAIEAASTPAFDEVRDEIEGAFRNRIAEDEFVTLSARLGELVFEHLDLRVPSEKTGLPVKTTPPLTRNASSGLTSYSAVSDIAFGPDVLIDGNNSDVIELTDDRHLVLRVKEHAPSETRTLGQVRDDIRLLVQEARARELVEARARDIVDRIRGGSLAQYVADQHGLSWVRGEGTRRNTSDMDESILVEAFALPRPREGKESVGHAVMPNGDTVVLRLSGVDYPDAGALEEARTPNFARVLSSQLGAMDFAEFEKSRLASADISRQ